MAVSHSVPQKPVGLTIKLPWHSVDEFAVKFAKNLSDNGFFVKTSEPKPRATQLAFKVMLASGELVLQGTAISRWVRGEGDPLGPAGMGVEFLSLDPASRALFNKMLAQLKAAPAAQAVPPRATPAPAAPPRTTPSHGLPAASAPSADDLFADVFGTRPGPPPADLAYGATFSDPEVFELLNASKK